MKIEIDGWVDRATTEQQTIELRFVHGRLQQKWRLFEIVGGQTIGFKDEWRYVPDATPLPQPPEVTE